MDDLSTRERTAWMTQLRIRWSQTLLGGEESTPLFLLKLPFRFTFLVQLLVAESLFLGSAAFVSIIRSKGKLSRPPGTRLLSAAEWLLPPKDAARIVGQAVADMREEHAQALADGRRVKARYIVTRDTARIVLAGGQAAWHRVGKFLLGFLKMVG